MTSSTTSFIPDAVHVRAIHDTDIDCLCALLNDIIEIGGTTAMEKPLSLAEFRRYYFEGDNHICCFVAEDERLDLLGFQSLERHPKLPADWADIATFSRKNMQRRGIGSALFGATKMYATTAGIVAINATIRADNTGGLAYYSKSGFIYYATAKAEPLRDGTTVDRISKHYIVDPHQDDSADTL